MHGGRKLKSGFAPFAAVIVLFVLLVGFAAVLPHRAAYAVREASVTISDGQGTKQNAVTKYQYKLQWKTTDKFAGLVDEDNAADCNIEADTNQEGSGFSVVSNNGMRTTSVTRDRYITARFYKSTLTNLNSVVSLEFSCSYQITEIRAYNASTGSRKYGGQLNLYLKSIDLEGGKGSYHLIKSFNTDKIPNLAYKRASVSSYAISVGKIEASAAPATIAIPEQGSVTERFSVFMTDTYGADCYTYPLSCSIYDQTEDYVITVQGLSLQFAEYDGLSYVNLIVDNNANYLSDSHLKFRLRFSAGGVDSYTSVITLERTKYTASFDVGGIGTETPASQSVVHGSAPTFPTPAAVGYTFLGWSETPTGDVLSAAPTMTASKTFYAKWSVNSYAVTLNADGGTIAAGNVSTYTYGIGATLPTEISKTGHTFGGWFTEANGGGTKVTAISQTETGDKTFYAKWTANTYSVTLETDGGTIDAGDVSSYTYGVGATLPTEISKTGHTFGGWYTEANGGGTKVTAISQTETGDKTFYAKWTANIYSVTLELDGGTVPTGNVTSYTYGVGASLPVNVLKAGGYKFTGFYDQASGGNRVTEISAAETGAKTFYAQYEILTFSADYSQTGYTITGFSEAYLGSLDTAAKNNLTITIPAQCEDGANGLANVVSVGAHAFDVNNYTDCLFTALDLSAAANLKTIGSYAFSAGAYANKLTIPNTVTEIGSYAFYHCTSFTALEFASGCQIKTVEDFAFNECGFQGQLTIPNTVTEIKANAFAYCANLTALTFAAESQLKIIGNAAFRGCSKIKGTLTIPKSVTTISAEAFLLCESFEGLRFETGSALAAVGQQAFAYNRGFRGALTLPNTVVTIEEYAFVNCGFDQTLTLPDNQAFLNIAKGSFSGCAFTGELRIPNSVSNLGASAFEGCAGFAALTLPLNEKQINLGTKAFFGCSGLTGTLTLPDNVAYLWSNAFDGVNYETIYLPNNANTTYGSSVFGSASVPLITADKAQYDVFHAAGHKLSGYDSLSYETTVTFDENGGTLTGEARQAKLYGLSLRFEKNEATGIWAENTAYELPTAARTGYLYHGFFTASDGSGTAVTVATLVADAPVYYANLELLKFTVSKDDSGYTITGFTALYLASLNSEEKTRISIRIPAKYDDSIHGEHPVVAIGANAFSPTLNASYDGYAFVSLDLSGAANLKTIGGGAFSGCSELTGALSIPDSVQTVGASAFYGCAGFNGLLTLPNNESFTEIADGAFYGCGFTGALAIPNSVINIGRDAFYGCGFTGALTLPNNANFKVIGRGAFRYCRNMSGDLNIPDSVTTIGIYAFDGCSGFQGTLTLPQNENFTTLEGSFRECGFTGVLKIPNSVTTIESYEFYDCKFLQTVYLPDNAMGTSYEMSVFHGVLCPVVAPSKERYSEYRTAGHNLEFVSKLTYETTVTFDGSGGTVAGDAEQTKLMHWSVKMVKSADGSWYSDETYRLPTASKTNYSFSGWNSKAYGEGFALNLVSAERYYAQYAEILDEIIVTNPPNRSGYAAYDTFDPTGMTVTARYRSGKTKTLSDAEYTVAYAENRASFRFGDNSVTVSYTENEIEKTGIVAGLDVAKKKFSKPTILGAYVYDGNEKKVTLENFIAEFMTVRNNTRTGAGKQSVTVTLKDTENCAWSDNAADPLSIVWIIEKFKVAKPTENTATFVYSGEEQTYTVTTSSYYTIAGDKRTNAGTQDVTIALNDTENFEWIGGGTGNIVFSFTIQTFKVAKPTENTATFVYSGEEQTYTVTTSSYYTIAGDKRTNAGTQDVTIALNDTENFEWIGGGTGNIVFSFTIQTYKVAKPTENTSMFVYSGEEQTYSVTTSSYYTIAGDKRTNAGTQDVTVALNDTENYEWTGGGTGNIVYSFAIQTYKVAKPTADATEFVYDGTAKTYRLAENAAYAIAGNVQSDAGEYKVVVSLKNPAGVVNYEWTAGGSADAEYRFVVQRQAVEKPSISGAYGYQGIELTANVVSTEQYAVTGNRQTDAGTYPVTVTLRKNYRWSDGDGAESIELTWTIAKKTLSVTPLYDGSAKVFVGGRLPALRSNESSLGAIQWEAGYDLSAPAENKAFRWIWTPNDQKNYETVTGNVAFTVLAVELKKITAAFAQDDREIYTSSSLDDLRAYLTVTGENNDGSEYAGTILYVLTGDLSVSGTATITVTATSEVTRTEISDTFQVAVTAVVLKEISAEFTQGDLAVYTSASIDDLKTLLGTALQVTKIYNDGATRETTDFTLAGDLTRAGTAEITVTAEGKTAKFYLTVTAVALNKITAIFHQGEIVVYASAAIGSLKGVLESGVSVTGTNNDGSAYQGGAPIAGYTLSLPSGVSELREGNNEIVVTFGGKVSSIIVGVTAVQIASVTAVFAQGANEVYPVTALSELVQWLTVTGKNNDGSDETNFKYELSGTLAAPASIVTVTVVGTDIADTFEVRVTEIAFLGISVTANPTKTRYVAYENFDPSGMVVTAEFNCGNETVTNYTVEGGTRLSAGTNSLTVSYTYEGATKQTTVSISVSKLRLQEPTIAQNIFTFNGEILRPELRGVDEAFMKVGGETGAKNAGEYFAEIKLRDPANCEWSGGSTEPLTLLWTIETRKVAEPTADTRTFTYHGAAQTYELGASEYYAAANNVRTNAGSQTVYAVLNDKENYEWESGGAEDISFTFEIAKASIDMSGVTFENLTLKEDGEKHKLEVSGLPNGVTATYTGDNGYIADGVSEAGVYLVTAVFAVSDEANYNVPKPMTALLTINRARLYSDAEAGAGERDTVVVSSEKGLEPDLQLSAEDVTETPHGVSVTEEDRELKQVVQIGLMKDGAAAEPSGAIRVMLKIGEELREEENLKVYFVGEDGTMTDVNAAREGDYLVFETTKLAKFAIVGDVPDTVSVVAIAATIVFWMLAFLSAVYLLSYFLKKKKNGSGGDGEQPNNGSGGKGDLPKNGGGGEGDLPKNGGGGEGERPNHAGGTDENRPKNGIFGVRERSTKTYSFAPIMLGAVIVPAGLTAALALGILAFAVLSGTILYLRTKDGTLRKLCAAMKTAFGPRIAERSENAENASDASFPDTANGSSPDAADGSFPEPIPERVTKRPDTKRIPRAADNFGAKPTAGEGRETKRREEAKRPRFGGVVYRRGFLAKIIQGSEQNKRYYSELKNELLSFDKMRSSLSFSAETFLFGRSRLAKLVVAGKTLKLYLALNPAAVEKKFGARDEGAKKKYAKTPCSVRVKSDLGRKRALILLERLAKEFGIAKDPFFEPADISGNYPYEETDALVARGLIKKTIVAGNETEKADVSEIIRRKTATERANPTFSDEAAAALFETASEPSGTNSRFAGKKAVVNLGALQTNFRPNETVTLETLKEKRLVPRGAGYLKILARGELDKPLTVEANDFSFDAVRAIALAGGKAIKRL